MLFPKELLFPCAAALPWMSPHLPLVTSGETMAANVLSPRCALTPAPEVKMSKRRSNTASQPEMLPWQAMVMVACVTAAGLLHQHPGAMRPLLSSHQTAQMRSSHQVAQMRSSHQVAQMRSSLTRTAPPATALLNAALRPAQ